MKYLITESTLTKVIEKYLYKSYDYIVSVDFHKTSVWLASDNRAHDRTVIRIIIDPYKILDGNIDGSFKSYDRDIRRKIWRDIDTYFGLEVDKYGSDWDIEVYGVRLTAV